MYFRKLGVEKDDRCFWQFGKMLLCTYALVGIGVFYRETSPWGWWKPEEEREKAHLHEGRHEEAQ